MQERLSECVYGCVGMCESERGDYIVRMWRECEVNKRNIKRESGGYNDRETDRQKETEGEKNRYNN